MTTSATWICVSCWGLAPFSDDRLAGLDWEATTPGARRGRGIEATGAPMLVRAGWLDAAFAAGALRRFATFANHQEVEIGAWGHGGGTFADSIRPGAALDGELLSPESQDRRLVEFFARFVDRGESPDGQPTTLHSARSGRTSGKRSVRGLQPVWRCRPGTSLRQGGWRWEPGPAIDVRHVTDRWASTGPANRWLAVDLGRGAAYANRQERGQIVADVHVRTVGRRPSHCGLSHSLVASGHVRIRRGGLRISRGRRSGR